MEFTGIEPNTESKNQQQEKEDDSILNLYGYQNGVPRKKRKKKSHKKKKKLKKAAKASKKQRRKYKKQYDAIIEEIKLLQKENILYGEQLQSIHRYMVKDCMDKIIKSDSESERRRLAASLMTGGRNDDWPLC